MENEEQIIDPMSEDFNLNQLNGSEDQKILIDEEILNALPNVDMQIDDAKAFPDKTIQKTLLIEWMALPTKYRKPRTLKEFCKKYDVDVQAVNRWKKDDDFIKQVQNLRKKNLIDQSGEVLDALLERAKKGEPSAIKLYFQYVENFMEGQKHEVNGTLADLMREIGNNDDGLVR